MKTRRQMLGLALLAVLVVLGSRTFFMNLSMLGCAQLILRDLPWFGSITVGSCSDVAAVPTIRTPSSSIHNSAEVLPTTYSYVVQASRVSKGHEQLSKQFEGLFLPAASDIRLAPAAVGTSSMLHSSVSSDPLARAAAAVTSFDSKILVLLMIVLLLITALVRQLRTNKILLRHLANQQLQHQRHQLQQETSLAENGRLQAQLKDLQELNAELQAQMQSAAAAPPAAAAISAVAAFQQIANFAPAHFATMAKLPPVWQLLGSSAGPAVLEAIRSCNLSQLYDLLAKQEASVMAICSVFGYHPDPIEHFAELNRARNAIRQKKKNYPSEGQHQNTDDAKPLAGAAKLGTVATFLICLSHMTAEHISAVSECVVDQGMIMIRDKPSVEASRGFFFDTSFAHARNNTIVNRALDPIMLAIFGDANAVSFNVRNSAFLMIAMLLRPAPL